MKGIAKFEKVSYKQFRTDVLKLYPKMKEFEEDIEEMYDFIKLPQRATEGSAGYDFYMPFTSYVDRHDSGKVVPTGIRCAIEPGWMLALFPRSGLGFEYGMALKNTVGIIDSDYYNADNEGHIMVKITTRENAVLEEGKAFAQGIFLEYGVTVDDAADGVRTGGFGSTDKQGV